MLTTRLAPMIPADIDFVIEHLWERGEAEAEKFGMTDKNEIGRYLHSLPREFAWTIWHGFSPLAVLIASRTDDGVYHTSFIATNEFPKAGLAATRILNRLFKQVMAAHPDKKFELWSASDHPSADKWFEVTGWKYSRPEGLFRVYESCSKNFVATSA